MSVIKRKKKIMLYTILNIFHDNALPTLPQHQITVAIHAVVTKKIAWKRKHRKKNFFFLFDKDTHMHIEFLQATSILASTKMAC